MKISKIISFDHSGQGFSKGIRRLVDIALAKFFVGLVSLLSFVGVLSNVRQPNGLSENGRHRSTFVLLRLLSGASFLFGRLKLSGLKSLDFWNFVSGMKKSIPS